ncbi:MAG: hypothetical protein ABIK92_19975 [Pseudomonadota bacterium]
METIKLSQYFEVPPEVAGYLEWGSGILRVNCSFEDWEFINNHPAGTRSFATRSIMATLTHETFHFLQICTSGFLYSFACQYFDLMRKYIKQEAGYPLTDEKIKAFLKNPSGVTDDIINHISVLDRPGSSGVTVRDIVESAAYLYEHKTHYIDLDIAGYEKFLSQDLPPKEYYHAFHKAKEILGKTAFDNFLFAAFISLCFSRPEVVFDDVLKKIADHKLIYRDDNDIPKFINAIQSLFSVHSALGSAAEVALRKGSQFWHPVYNNAILSLNETATQYSPIALVVDPNAMTIEAALSNVRPTVFNKNYILIPKSFEKGRSQNQLEEEMTVFILLGAMIMAIGRAGEVPSRFRTIAKGKNEYNG